jgi:hypothetical protein
MFLSVLAVIDRSLSVGYEQTPYVVVAENLRRDT